MEEIEKGIYQAKRKEFDFVFVLFTNLIIII